MAAWVLAASTVLQYAAAVLALRLVAITKHRPAWLLIASAVLLMAVRRSITLFRILSGDENRPPDLTAESIALLISMLMFAGIWRIGPLFTAIRDAAANASRSQRQLQDILDHTAAAVYVKDLDGRYLLVNDPASHVLGDDRTILGKTDFDLLPADVAEHVRRNDALVIEGARNLEFDETVPHPDGSLHHYLTIKFPVRDENGTLYAICGISTDITDRRRAEDERRAFESQLQQSQKLESLGLLAGGIAHDFNNLLVAMLGGTELALSHDELPHEVEGDLKNVQLAAQAAAGLCQQLLAYSGGGQLRMAPLDVSELVDNLAQLMDLSISKKAKLSRDLARGLPAIDGDASQIQQVVLNLITNASEALAAQGGSIWVSTSLVEVGPAGLADQQSSGKLEPGNYVCIEVRDDGVGMDEQTRARLFDPFYTTKFTGRGLGLAAVLGIVRGHGGAICLTSTPGVGTSFRVLFPVSAHAPAREAKELVLEREREPRSETILVVDDEPLVRRMATTILERRGFRVLTADNGRQALELLADARQHVALVLLDMTMPEMDGAQTLTELERLDIRVPVIMTSGYDQKSTTRRGSPESVSGFLQKPYTARKLVAAVDEVLKAQHQHLR